MKCWHFPKFWHFKFAIIIEFIDFPLDLVILIFFFSCRFAPSLPCGNNNNDNRYGAAHCARN